MIDTLMAITDASLLWRLINGNRVGASYTFVKRDG
jgi:hypothetical protein